MCDCIDSKILNSLIIMYCEENGVKKIAIVALSKSDMHPLFIPAQYCPICGEKYPEKAGEE